MNVYGELTRAQIENLTSDPSLAAVTKGRLWMRTDLSTLKVDLGGSADTLAMLAAAQTFTNKIFGDGINFTQIATPSNPSSGFNKIYPKSDGNFYTLNSSGIEAQLGSGGGGGVKNYLGNVNNVNGNGNFELGSTSGWSLAHSSLSGLIPTSVATPGSAFSAASGGTAATSLGLQTLQSTTVTPTATWVSGNNFITVSLATGIVQGMLVTNPGAGTGFPTAPIFVTNVSGTSIYLNKALTGTQASVSSMSITSAPLAGVYSLAFGTNSQAGPVSSTAGDMLISQAFTIDAEDKAKMMTGKFYYQNQAGTTPQFAGGATNTFAVWVYDVTNGVWIQPAGVYNMAQGTGVGICTFTFQTTSNSTQYQVAIINQLGLVGVSYNLWLDDFSIGPNTVPQGAAISDWQSYTPTYSAGWGSVTNSDVWWRRVGDSIHLKGSFKAGTVAGSIGTIGLPSGLAIDTTKLSAVTGIPSFGRAWRLTSTGQDLTTGTGSIDGEFYYNGSNTVIQYARASGSLVFSNESVSAFLSSNDVVTFDSVVLPIAGWSSNTVFSNDTDTREVSMIALKNGGSAVAGSTTAAWTSIVKDTHGQFNLTTGVYTIPVTGRYQVTHTMGGSAATANPMIFKNSTNTIIGPAGTRALVTDLVDCVAGDTISVQTSVNSTLTGDTTSTRLVIARVSGPASIAGNETVAARGTNTAGTSIASATDTLLPVVVDYDTNGGQLSTTGLYTAPISGKYSLKGLVTFNDAVGSGDLIELKFKKNTSTTISDMVYAVPLAGTNRFGGALSDTVRLLAGETIGMYVAQNSGAGRVLDTGTGRNVFAVERIGNY